jgi:hypothetical protein
VNIENKERKKETEDGRKRSKERKEGRKSQWNLEEITEMNREERKEKERNRKNREKWEVIYTDVQVETSNDICDAVTSPRDAVCLWIVTHMAATPSSFHLAFPPIVVLL